MSVPTHASAALSTVDKAPASNTPKRPRAPRIKATEPRVPRTRTPRAKVPRAKVPRAKTSRVPRTPRSLTKRASSRVPSLKVNKRSKTSERVRPEVHQPTVAERVEWLRQELRACQVTQKECQTRQRREDIQAFFAASARIRDIEQQIAEFHALPTAEPVRTGKQVAQLEQDKARQAQEKESLDLANYSDPDVCAECGTPLVLDAVRLSCPNPRCGTSVLQKHILNHGAPMTRFGEDAHTSTPSAPQESRKAYKKFIMPFSENAEPIKPDIYELVRLQYTKQHTHCPHEVKSAKIGEIFTAAKKTKCKNFGLKIAMILRAEEVACLSETVLELLLRRYNAYQVPYSMHKGKKQNFLQKKTFTHCTLRDEGYPEEARKFDQSKSHGVVRSNAQIWESIASPAPETVA